MLSLQLPEATVQSLLFRLDKFNQNYFVEFKEDQGDQGIVN
jgi:hypothetical protein